MISYATCKQVYLDSVVVQFHFWHGCLLHSEGSLGCSTSPGLVICVALGDRQEIYWGGKRVGGHVNLINVLESMLTQMEESTLPLNGAAAWLGAASICTWAQLSHQCSLQKVAVTSVLGTEISFRLNWERLHASLHKRVWNSAQDQGSRSHRWTFNWCLSVCQN